MPRLLLILLLVVSALSAAESEGGGEQYYAKRWLTDDGLPHNTVNQIVQDAQGYMWLATLGGLARFDGHDFREFKLPPEFRSGGPNIRALLEESPSSLLVVPTGGSVVRWNGAQFSQHPVSRLIQGRQPVAIFQDRSAALWLGFSEGGLARWTADRLTTFDEGRSRFPANARYSFAEDASGRTWIAAGPSLASERDGTLVPFPLEPTSANFIIAGSRGRIWVCSDNALFGLEEGRLRRVTNDVPWKGNALWVSGGMEDRQGVLWIAAGRLGLFQLKSSRLVRVAENFGGVSVVTEDRESNLWVGAGGEGLGLLQPKIYRTIDAASGLRDNYSNTVASDRAGTLWLANRTDGLVSLGPDGVKTPFYHAAGNPQGIYTACAGADGRVWFGGRRGLFRYDPRQPAPAEELPYPRANLHVLFAARNGDLWFAGDPGSLGFYHLGAVRVLAEPEGYAHQVIRAIAQDSAGTIWLGALNGDLLEFQNGKLAASAFSGQMGRQPIHAICSGPSGTLWIATAGGLIAFQAGHFRRFDQRDGLPDDMIMQVLEDGRGNLWCASRRGFFYVAISQLLQVGPNHQPLARCHLVGKDQGLAGFSPLLNYQPATARTPEGKLLFATSNGVVAFDPARIQANAPAPTVLIDGVSVDGLPVAVGPQVRLPAGKHRIEFHFAALTYRSPANLVLRHQLEGADPTWVTTDESRTANYSGLPPGQYRMRVAASASPGEALGQAEPLVLAVTPAWWQTAWFRVIGLVGFAGLVGAGIHEWTRRRMQATLRELQQQHALEMERARIARDLHDELGGSLTEIGLLADRLKESGPRELPAELGSLARRTRQLAAELASIVWALSPQNDSLDRLARFLHQYAVRIFRNSAIRCVVTGAETIPPRPLTPDVQHHLLAAAKEALNNAIKHSQASIVTVTLSFQGERFTLVIADDGVGFESDRQAEFASNGLANLRSRSREMGANLALTSIPRQGTRVQIDLPCLSLSPSSKTIPASPRNSSI